MHHYVLDNVDKKGAYQETKKKMFVSPFYEKKDIIIYMQTIQKIKF